MENIPEIQLLPHPETGELVPEVWVDILDYGPFYKVSNYGRVVSIKNDQPVVLKQHLIGPKRKLYYSVSLYKNKKCNRKVTHVLCYNSFFGRCEDKRYVIDHKDNDRFNNFLPNLQRISIRLNNTKDREREPNRLPGVYRDRNGGWAARVCHKRQSFYLGYGRTQEEAHIKFLDGIKRLGIEHEFALNLDV